MHRSIGREIKKNLPSFSKVMSISIMTGMWKKFGQ